MDLVIVESPAKAKTINKYLGSGYKVEASMGHVRDLPKRKLGVDPENDFAPEYQTIRGRGKMLATLRRYAAKADMVYLAPDPDREGEAIAWHLVDSLNIDPKKIKRVTFNAITKKAIQQAFSEPSDIDMNKVNAQQARRILDRLVGYTLSPLLWKKITRGLSAGRVQSVAVKKIVDREREIEAFVPVEYWTIFAMVSPKDEHKTLFKADLIKIDGKSLQTSAKEAELRIGNKDEAQKHVSEIQKQDFVIESINEKDTKQRPNPPMITSQLQQQAFNRFGFSSKKTMVLAQRLYEGVKLGSEGQVGLITYMRTDSVRIVPEALAEIRTHIEDTYGKAYLPEKAQTFKSKKSAQEAHEAIRPSDFSKTPDAVKKYLEPDQFKIYNLIWERTIASQMKPAQFKDTTIKINAGPYLFQSKGRVMTFDGFIKLTGYKAKDDASQMLPELSEKLPLHPHEVTPEEHHTKPPPRYNEASLVRLLEKEGIGRPSTYAPIISTIQDRGYVELMDRKFHPLELGRLVIEELEKHFPNIVDTNFTAQMENRLDDIAEEGQSWSKVVGDFYWPFMKDMEKADANMQNHKDEKVLTDVPCPLCKEPMLIRWSKRGQFFGCSKFPDCSGSLPMGKDGKPEKPETTKETCDDCGSAMTVKTGRYGKFLACSKYPDCKGTKSMPTGFKCPIPDCGGDIVPKRSKRGRPFFGCNKYPNCNYIINKLPKEGETLPLPEPKK